MSCHNRSPIAKLCHLSNLEKDKVQRTNPTACTDDRVESFDEVGVSLADAVDGVGDYFLVAVPVVGFEAAPAQSFGDFLELHAGG